MKNIVFVFIITVLLAGCGTSRIMINADIPESQQVDIRITTQNNENE